MSEGKRLCWRCDEPITKGQPHTEYPKISLSAGGAQIVLHNRCRRPPAFVRRTP